MSLFKKVSKYSMVVAAAFVMSTAGAVDLSKPDFTNGKHIFENGKELVVHPHSPTEVKTVPGEAAEARAGIEVPACTTCHGQDGMGNEMMGTPRLAGQVYQFLVKQLEDFATEKRMDTTMYVMNMNAKGLSSQDRIDVAAYLSTLDGKEVATEITEDMGVPHLGMALVKYGNVERGISSCAACHEYNGRGADPIYPMIRMQKYSYLVKQLNDWRSGSRANDPMAQMQKIAQNLTDDDIKNLAAYLSSQASSSTIGNYRTPVRHTPFH